LFSEINRHPAIIMLKQIFISTILIAGLIANSAIAQNLDSRAGDEAALEALAGSLDGLGSGWSRSGISLSNSIDGVSVETINGELRVTEINLNNNGLTGDIEVNELLNLKQMELFSIYQNSLVSQVPQELMDLTMHSLKYIYLCRANNFGLGAPLPHEESNGGASDVHPGKSKTADENNRWTGVVPAPSTPSSSILEWFTLNFSDSDFTSTDGISGFESSFYDITTFKGLQHYHNNAVSQSFPDNLMNATGLVQLDIGGRNGGSENWLTGDVPASFGNLTNLHHFRFNNSTNLTFDFGVVDLSGMTELWTIGLGAIELVGEIPDYLFDGTMSDVTAPLFSWPMGGTGFKGAFPEVAVAMNVKVFQFRNHNLTSLPASLWENSPSVIQPEFTDNQLTTLGTTDLTNMYQMRYFWVGGNELHENWPYLDWDNHSRMTGSSGADFRNNRYVFKHMLYVPPNASNGETVLELWQDIAENVYYSPQKPFGQSRIISISSGSDVTIDDFNGVVTHTDNAYQWQKDGTNISGATSRSLTIAGAQDSDAGTYRLIVTNSNIPDLTLTSKAITIDVGEGKSTDSPRAPSLISPDDGTTGISTPPTLDWESSSGAETYRVQIGTTSDFSSLVTDNSGLSSTQYGASELSDGTTYYWRVNASNSAGSSNWSASREFSTESSSSATAPSEPTLNSPDDGATGISTSPSLDWNSSTDAETYRLQLSTTADFSSVITDSSGLTSTQYTESGLSNSTTYYWRVLASNSAGSSNWSSSRNFVTVESQSDELPAPVQISPNDGANNTLINPTIDWEPVDGADYYVLHVGQPDSAVEVVDVQITDSQYDVPDSEKFEPNALYKWRVHAVKNDVAGEWSPIWEFATDSTDTGSGGPLGSKTTVSYQEGWNLVSLPRDLSDKKFENIFTDIDPSSIYSFEGTYTKSSELVPGNGYWIKLLSGQEVVFEGDPISSLNLSLTQGWNLIGGPVSSVDIQSEISDSQNIIEKICKPTGETNSSCESVTSLEPGKAYFIKVSDAGNISLN